MYIIIVLFGCLGDVFYVCFFYKIYYVSSLLDHDIIYYLFSCARIPAPGWFPVYGLA